MAIKIEPLCGSMRATRPRTGLNHVQLPEIFACTPQFAMCNPELAKTPFPGRSVNSVYDEQALLNPDLEKQRICWFPTE